MLGLAAGVVVVAGIHAVPDIIGPIFMALVLTITVNPMRGLLIRRGASRWLASLVVILTVYAIVIGLVVAAAIGVVQFVGLMPQYADQIQNELTGSRVGWPGWVSPRTRSRAHCPASTAARSWATSRALLSGVMSVLTSLFFIITLLIFLAVDGSVFNERMVKHRPGREPVLNALGQFAAAPASTSRWPPSSAASSPCSTGPPC